MTDFSKIFSGQSKSEIKPQIHNRRPALSQSFPSRSTTGDSTTVREQLAKRRDWDVYGLSSASVRSPDKPTLWASELQSRTGEFS